MRKNNILGGTVNLEGDVVPATSPLEEKIKLLEHENQLLRTELKKHADEAIMRFIEIQDLKEELRNLKPET